MPESSHFRLREYEPLQRAQLTEHQWRALRRMDEAREASGNVRVFDWGLRSARARNLVGVVRVGALTVDILPKVDERGSENAQANLLYMLQYAGRVPVADAGLAKVAVESTSLLDALARRFVESLLCELRRGPDRGYRRVESDQGFVQGQIDLRVQSARTAAQMHRIRVRHDEFDTDTELNRVLRAATRALLRGGAGTRNTSGLSRVLSLLDGASDRRVTHESALKVVFNRNNKRFKPLYEFACMVLFGQSPAPRAGSTLTFSIVFPMDRVFEEFVAVYVTRNASRLGLEPRSVFPQTRSRRRYLLRLLPKRAYAFQLKPDLLIEKHEGFSGAILDTKWKRLAKDRESRRNGVSTNDVYQMQAYASRYQLKRNVLLYPSVAGVSPKTYEMPGEGQVLVIATLRLSGDLRRDRTELDADLVAALRGQTIAQT